MDETEKHSDHTKYKTIKTVLAVMALLLIAIVPAFASYAESGNTQFQDGEFDFASLSRLEHLALACELDGEYYYFSRYNWNNIPADVRSRFTKKGVVVIGNGEKFILDLHDNGEELTWDEAMSRYGERLPTLSQGEAMAADYDAINAAISAFGGDKDPEWYWTKTECEYNSSIAWIVIMSYGDVYENDKAYIVRVRAVSPIADDSPVAKTELSQFDFASLSQLEHLALACELDGEYYYFSRYNWNNIPVDVRSHFTKKGIVVIGNGEKFILDLHDNGEELTWDEAMSRYGERLPTLSQGEAMAADYDAINAAITAFGGDKDFGWAFWTRTEYERDVSCAWSIFILGNLDFYKYDKTYTLRVRAVFTIPDEAQHK